MTMFGIHTSSSAYFTLHSFFRGKMFGQMLKPFSVWNVKKSYATFRDNAARHTRVSGMNLSTSEITSVTMWSFPSLESFLETTGKLRLLLVN